MSDIMFVCNKFKVVRRTGGPTGQISWDIRTVSVRAFSCVSWDNGENFLSRT